VAAAISLVTSVPVLAQGKTDVAVLANGDRITGELQRLQYGRLVLDTDDAGTLSLEWDKLASIVATARPVEVVTTDGRRFVGTLTAAAPRSIAVTDAGGTVSVAMREVTLITPMGLSFWSKLDGAVDAGFSYTRSSGVAQLNGNWETVYRKPAFSGRIAASLTQTSQEDDESEETEDESDDDDRASIEASYLRYPWQRWFVFVATRFENNKSLGLVLRSQLNASVGPRLINGSRTQLTASAGLSVNDERGVDVDSTRNLEALLALRTSYYTYDRPRTTFELAFQYYPSLTSWGRQRVQLDVVAKRELWKDLFVSLSLYNTFDSRPPNASADRNDIGIVTSIGWTY
jgi:hypothetical protein